MLLMQRLLKTLKTLGVVGLVVVLLAACLSLPAGCQSQKQAEPPPAAGIAPESDGQGTGKPGSEPAALTITGNGVAQECRFTLSELKGMEESLAGACYSAVNNWPAKKFFVGRGIKVTHLLQKAGIRDDSQTIIFKAVDGYNARFTREQLDEKRFCYPNLMKGSAEGAYEVPMLLAWEYQEDTTDLSKAAGGKLRLLLGQTALGEVATAAFVKDVSVIEVLTAPPGRWSIIQAEPAPGKVERETEIVLSHPEQDLVKIYYTTDGSAPNEKSQVYNPSTTYFQPDLNKPIPVDNSVTIKAMVSGFGKHNSQVAIFKYDVE